MRNAPHTISAEGLAERISRVLRGVFADRRHAVKTLADRIWADPRAVENWLAANCAPRSAEMIRLMAAEPEIEAEILMMVAEARTAIRAKDQAARERERRLISARLERLSDALGDVDAGDRVATGQGLAAGGARV